MVARFFVQREDLLGFQADVWEQNQLTKVADQWERNALQRLNEQVAPPPQPTAAPSDFLQQQQQRLGWSPGADELAQQFEQSTEHVQRLTSQVNPSIPSPPPEPVAAPVAAPPDLRSLNTTGEQYTPPSSMSSPTGGPSPFGSQPATAPSGSLVDYARQAAQRAGLDPDMFVRQINQESGFSIGAQSGAGARGIAQIVPRFHPGVNPDNPTEALDYAANLMASHKRTYGRDDLALVAYNGGQGAVNAYLAGRPYAESQQYVSRILGGGGGAVPASTDQRIAGAGPPASLNLSQFGDKTLTAEEAYAACGPAAAARLAATYGNNIPLSAALAAAKKVGWTPGGGMNGISNQKRLLDVLGVPAEMDTSRDWNRIVEEAGSGRIVTLSTPGHYFSANGTRKRSDGQTELYVGQSGLDLKGGKAWMTPQEIEQRMGSLSGALFSDPSRMVTAGEWGIRQAEQTGLVIDDETTALAELDQAVEKAGLRQPQREQSPLEQITNPFGEAFRQVGDVVGGVAGGALEAVRGAGAGLDQTFGISERQQQIEANRPSVQGMPAPDLTTGIGQEVGRRADIEREVPGQLYEADVAAGRALADQVVDRAKEQGWQPDEQTERFVRGSISQITPSNVLMSALTAGQGPIALQLARATASMAGGAVLGSGARTAAEMAGLPEPVQAGAEVLGSLAGGIGAPAAVGRVLTSEGAQTAGQAAGRLARSRLPAEAEAGFAAGMPRPPDIPTPPTGAAAAAADVFAPPTGPVSTANILDSPNYKRLQAMRGTAEQAAELAPERPGFAGNINLDKITPDDVKVALREAAEENNLFAGQRRGVISDPEARQNAARVALNMAPEDWIKTKPGRAFNQEEALALGETMVRTGNDYSAMRAALAAAEVDGTATDLMRAATADKALEMALLEGVRSGAASEAGRALRSFRTALEGALRSKTDDPAKAFRTALKAIGTDEDRYAQWVKAWDALAPDDVVGKYRMLQALHQPSKMNKLVAFTTSNMLSGNKTLEVNLVGGGIETLNRPLIELLGGRPVDAWTDLTAMGRAVGQGFANAGTAFTTGVRPSQAARTLAEGKYDNVRPEAFGGKLGAIVTPALRVMSATDEFIRTINSAGGLAVAARREARATGKTVQEILAEPPEHVLKFAQDAADEAVFEGGGTPFSKGIGAWRNLINSSNPLERTAGVAGHVLFPFVNIPEQILIRGGRMLPGINEASTILKIRKGLQSGDQQVVRDAVGRYVLTNAVLLATGSQVLAGNITGNGPKDASKRASLEAARDENGNKIWQAHSIKVGDRWIDYTNLGPVAIPLATLSNAHEAYLESGKRPGANEVVDVFNRVGDTMLDATYIKSFGELMKAIGEGNSYKAAGSLIGNTVSRGVPLGGAFASVERALDQETKQPRNLPEYIASRIPWVSEAVPDKPSPFGGTVQQPQEAVAILSPFRTSAPGEPDPLARAFVDVGIGAPTVPSTISMTNLATRQASPPMALNDDEKRQYVQLMGDRLRELAQPSLNSPKWQQESAMLRTKPPDTWTDADRQIAETHKKALEKMTEDARNYAKVQLYESWTPDERQRRMAEGAGARMPEPILGR